MIPKDAKIAVVKRQLQLVENSLYSSQIDVRVAESIKDEQMKKAAVAQLNKFEKMRDGYEKILKEVEKEKESTNPDLEI